MDIYKSDRYSIRPMREVNKFYGQWEWEPATLPPNGDTTGITFSVYRSEDDGRFVVDRWLADCGTEADAREIVNALELRDETNVRRHI